MIWQLHPKRAVVPRVAGQVPVVEDQTQAAGDQVAVVGDQVAVVDDQVAVVDDQVAVVEHLSLKSSKLRCQAMTKTGTVLCRPMKSRLSIVDSELWLVLLMRTPMAVSRRQSLPKQ